MGDIIDNNYKYSCVNIDNKPEIKKMSQPKKLEILIIYMVKIIKKIIS